MDAFARPADDTTQLSAQKGKFPTHVPLQKFSSKVVASVRVDKFLESHHVSSILLMMDCETCEYRALSELAEAGWLME
eukprot:3214743-Prymnesium_polylepis.1